MEHKRAGEDSRDINVLANSKSAEYDNSSHALVLEFVKEVIEVRVYEAVGIKYILSICQELRRGKVGSARHM